MSNYIFLAVCCGFTVIQASGSANYSTEDVSRLEDDLLDGYKVSARPFGLTLVTLSMFLSNVLELNIVDQTCSISTFVTSMWTDPRLQWNETEYGGTDGIYLHSDQIWKPPVYLHNSAKEFRIIGDEAHQKSMPVWSSSSGWVFWYAPGYFVGRCEANVSNFPFDRHTCRFLMMVWLYGDDFVQLRHSSNNILELNYEANSEWDITDTSKDYVDASIRGNPYHSLSFAITLQRRTSYYILYVLFPIVVFNIVGAVVFAVPPGSGEKMTFSLSMLLSITVLMTIVGEKIPTSSMQVSKLGVYLVCSMGLNILEVIFTVLILRLYNAGLENEPVSRAWQTIIQSPCNLLKRRSCCQSKASIKIASGSVVKSTTEKREAKAELKFVHDGRDTKQLNYKEIAVKLDQLCFYVFMTLAALTFIVFVLTLTLE